MVNYCTKNRACETSPKFFPRMRGSIRMNRVMMIPENIEKDNIPLSVSDMMDVNEEFYVKTNDKHETFFLGTMNVDAFIHWDYRDQQDLPDLRYDITIVKMP